MIAFNFLLATFALTLAYKGLGVRLPIEKWKERACRGLAWMLPREIVYWCVIRVWCHASATTHQHVEVSALTAPDILKSWKP